MSLEDTAQEHEAAEWEMRNRARAARPTFKPGDEGYGPEDCDDCGAEMPSLRRENGWRLCTACQTLIEKRRPG